MRRRNTSVPPLTTSDPPPLGGAWGSPYPQRPVMDGKESCRVPNFIRLTDTSTNVIHLVPPRVLSSLHVGSSKVQQLPSDSELIRRQRETFSRPKQSLRRGTLTKVSVRHSFCLLRLTTPKESPVHNYGQLWRCVHGDWCDGVSVCASVHLYSFLPVNVGPVCLRTYVASQLLDLLERGRFTVPPPRRQLYHL